MFEIEIIFPITKNLSEDEELTETQQLQNHTEGFGVALGYWDLALDPIVQMNPKCFIPKENKKYYTEVVFQSGNISLANCKPEILKGMISEFLNTSN